MAKIYRTLSVGEVSIEGDQILLGEKWYLLPKTMIGDKIHTEGCYRRPSFVLEAAIALLKAALKDKEVCRPIINEIEDLIEAVAKELGEEKNVPIR